MISGTCILSGQDDKLNLQEIPRKINFYYEYFPSPLVRRNSPSVLCRGASQLRKSLWILLRLLNVHYVMHSEKSVCSFPAKGPCLVLRF